MDHSFLEELLIVLTTGLVAGYLCRQIGLPPLMGYLAMGSLLSESVLGWVSSDVTEITHLAEMGVFFLLFSIGLELSLEELRRMGRHLLVGGSVQMLLVAAPVTAILMARSWSMNTAILVAMALAFSSTVLVFKSLGEAGQTSAPLGRRAIAILLFQDAALVPLLLCVPLLAGGDAGAPGGAEWGRLALVSVGFVTATVSLRYVLNRWVIPQIAQHRSPDLVVLMTLTILGTVTLLAQTLGLPPALGSFAAGLAFGGNRWSEQVDSLILPFREAFSAIFFVSLGLLIDVSEMIHQPLLIAGGILMLTLIKAAAATFALRTTGRPLAACWRPGLGLAHVGEFAFVLILIGASDGLITPEERTRVMTVAGATLLIAPVLIRWGFADSDDESAAPEETSDDNLPLSSAAERHCLVIGMGPVGRAVAGRLETLGYSVSVIDSNPLNLQAFAQHGFVTVAGDGEQDDVLLSAGVARAQIVVICIPIDEVAHNITARVRALNTMARIVVRCRYARQVDRIRKAGADVVTSEEARSTRELVEVVEKLTIAG